ncbi:GLIPR1-like protein 2 [Balearica regulorum gibbericeps]|uniref:GLIPR1-like protein 2 n=1 Tax=Balearica regulorum gibbericeps TaxID=100784 RepID=UPI003F5D9EB8
MRRWVAVVALWLVLRAVARQVPALPSIMDKTFIEDCVHVHNELRTTVRPAASNMRYMTWDSALARTARAWANKCIFKHNVHLSKKHQCHPNFTSIGENIWAGSHQAFSVADAIKSWYNEVRFYTIATQKCTKVCSHYIQVVWDYSYKIGCAVTLCKEIAGIRNAANFICNYSPSGNFPRKPYVEGKWCSNCAKGDNCENKLCRNPERDKIIYYSRWHPPWEFRIVCDEACIALVVLRPLLMILAFVAVYFIKKRFTNMHMST